MFYYFIAYKNRPNPDKKLLVSVPSGNFGNLCAGVMSKMMGLPINHLIASTNINDTVPEYLKSGNYNPKKSIQTITNAMDVGDPSNFIRIQKIFNNDFFKLKKIITGFSYNDKLEEKALKHKVC
jgi:threonine synthase